ncbi:BQ5605_C001g00328 [Microbotryum silenes-dioicae]|uniref:BQ5605_C001g00328 protein n=1 Tax=Microbotryum silenes-dioicae TaxID=796604 RepID=A0A2X0M6Y6_9BASI|nr:BQ5605_C001g00328 [Microbotryum silenes-dioicae]
MQGLGGTVNASGIGSVKLITDNGTKLILNDVIYVPESPANCKARTLLRATGIRNRDRAHLASSVPSPSG